MAVNPYTAGGPKATTALNNARGNLGDDGTRYGESVEKDGWGIVRRLVGYIGPHMPALVVTFVVAAVSVLFQLYIPILIGRAIDQMLGAGKVDFAALAPIAYRLLACVLLAAATQWLQGYLSTKLANETVRDLRDDAFAKLHKVPLSLLDAASPGDLLARIVSDADLVGEGLLQGFNQILSGVVMLVATICFMVSISVPVAFIVVLTTPISLFVASAIARGSAKGFAEQQMLQGELGGFVEEMVTNQHLVAAFGRGEKCLERFDRTNERLRVVGERSQFVSSLTNPSTRIVNNFVYAIVALVGCMCVITGRPSVLTVGQVQVFLSYANQFMKPFNEVSSAATQFSAALASARRIFELIDATEEASEDEKPSLDAGKVRGKVEMRGVTFSYDHVTPVVQGIDLVAQPGQRIALVGHTGCGKTTLINLLMRFYEQDEGVILLDGADTRSFTRGSLRQAFGMVLQDSWLFGATVRDNVAFGLEDVSDEEVWTALRAAHADKFVMQLPQGLDTQVREEGGTLSAGQCQLLCIARAMLQDAPILILDEATSSIDSRTERLVQEACDRMMRGRTSIVVAHRLSTIQGADTILMMDHGRVIERGSHEELLARHGAYERLYLSQWSDTDDAHAQDGNMQ